MRSLPASAGLRDFCPGNGDGRQARSAAVGDAVAASETLPPPPPLPPPPLARPPLGYTQFMVPRCEGHSHDQIEERTRERRSGVASVGVGAGAGLPSGGLGAGAAAVRFDAPTCHRRRASGNAWAAAVGPVKLGCGPPYSPT